LGEESVFGVVSLVFWAVVLTVTVKYVLVVMRADNEGEGGIMALIALLARTARKRTTSVAVLAGLGIFGASLFAGDSMITPAISVLSAVEGLEVVAPSFEHLVVPISVAILIGLFAYQRRGTDAVGRLFGPVMLVWFAVLGVLGAHGVAQHPGVLRGLSPVWGARFFLDDGLTAFLALGGVVLVVTGAEALYADMGHFGRGAIARAWLLIAFPALILNYLGQGALILERPGDVSNPFYLLVPDWARVPMVLLSCLATVIASQAVISGAFSITRQAVQLGYLPRLRILHTSKREIGQVYVPFVNWALLAAVLVLVFAFERAENLAYAYGVAVTGTFTITLLLFLVIMRMGRHRPLWQLGLLGALFGTVDLAFFGANVVKVLSGGWLPLVTAVGVFTVFQTWQRGREIVTRNREHAEGSLAEFAARLRKGEPPVRRVPGVAVFMNRGTDTTPLALRENVEHNRTLHEHVLIVSIDSPPVPYVPDAERVEVDDTTFQREGITLVIARYGFQEQPDVPAIVWEAAAHLRSAFALDDVSYFLSKIEIVQTDAPGLAPWRKRLFLATANVATDAADYFQLPRQRTVLLGSAIDV
jgi:KUP system potassium uptake protein